MTANYCAKSRRCNGKGGFGAAPSSFAPPPIPLWLKRVFEIHPSGRIFFGVRNKKEPVTDDIPFEESLERLEAIVESLEEGEVPLADLLAKYEEGNALLRACGKRLQDAELKIEQLKQAGKTESLEPFESITTD